MYNVLQFSHLAANEFLIKLLPLPTRGRCYTGGGGGSSKSFLWEALICGLIYFDHMESIYNAYNEDPFAAH